MARACAVGSFASVIAAATVAGQTGAGPPRREAPRRTERGCCLVHRLRVQMVALHPGLLENRAVDHHALGDGVVLDAVGRVDRDAGALDEALALRALAVGEPRADV